MKRIFVVLLLSLTLLLTGCQGGLPFSFPEEASASRPPITLELSLDPSAPENLHISWGPSALELADALKEAEVTFTGGESGAPESITVRLVFREVSRADGLSVGKEPSR